jgi:hypothetical protein
MTQDASASQEKPDVGLREFQRLIHQMYFDKDEARGVEGTFMWFTEEVGELATIEQRPTQDGRNMTMMLAPGRVTSEDGAAPAEEQKKQRRPPQSRPAGSGQPAEIQPDQI